MDRVFQVTCWVAAFLVLAIGGRTGLMDEEAVSTLLIILPLVAYLSISQRGACPIGRAS